MERAAEAERKHYSVVAQRDHLVDLARIETG